MSDDADTLAWLRDREELRSLAQRYARAVDARDKARLEPLFHPEGEVTGARGTSAVPAYLEALCNGPQSFVVSMHVLGESLVEHEPGADTANLDTYAVVYQLQPVDPSMPEMTLGIRYVDACERHEGRWVIRSRTATTRWMRTTPSPD